MAAEMRVRGLWRFPVKALWRELPDGRLRVPSLKEGIDAASHGTTEQRRGPSCRVAAMSSAASGGP